MKGKMSDRRGYEENDLKKASKAVQRKGGKAAFTKAMKAEDKDYKKDVKAYKKKK
jgi:hypothetical protein